MVKDISKTDLRIFYTWNKKYFTGQEGFERDGKKEFINFLYISKGSLGETRSQVHRSFDANHFNEEIYNDLLNDCLNLSGKISHFIGYLSKSGFDGIKKK
jgi:hypothetical protein